MPAVALPEIHLFIGAEGIIRKLAYPLHLPLSCPRRAYAPAGGTRRQGKQMGKTKEINLRVGRGKQVGSVTLSTWLPDRIFLSVSFEGGYSPTVVLTPEQVEELRRALDEIAPQGERRGEERLRLVA